MGRWKANDSVADSGMSVFRRLFQARGDPQAELRVQGAMLSDVGLVREHNEDVVAWTIPRAGRGMIALVADGIGGRAAGEVASALAAGTIIDVFYRTPGTIRQALAAAFSAANQAIRDHGAANPDCRGMGTTCTAFSVCGGGALLAHIGDSRAYVWRAPALHQVSRDHSLVAQLYHDGLIGAEEAAVHPDRNVILKALGLDDTCEPDLWVEPWPLRQGDVLLLCSDGLSDLVADGTIAAIVSTHPPAEACAALRDAALAGGGHDNISVGVFAVSAVPAESARD